MYQLYNLRLLYNWKPKKPKGVFDNLKKRLNQFLSPFFFLSAADKFLLRWLNSQECLKQVGDFKANSLALNTPLNAQNASTDSYISRILFTKYPILSISHMGHLFCSLCSANTGVLHCPTILWLLSVTGDGCSKPGWL